LTRIATEFVRGPSITIRGISAVLRIVLPVTSLTSVHVIAVKIVVLIEIIVVVDVDVAAVPIAVAPMAAPSAPSSGAQRNSRSPH
jgi:hypothetical protein